MNVVWASLSLFAQFAVYALFLYFLFTWAEAFKDYWRLAPGNVAKRIVQALLASVDAPIHAYVAMLRNNLRAALGTVMLMVAGSIAQIAPPKATLGACFAFFVATAWAIPIAVAFIGRSVSKKAEAKKEVI